MHLHHVQHSDQSEDILPHLRTDSLRHCKLQTLSGTEMHQYQIRLAVVDPVLITARMAILYLIRCSRSVTTRIEILGFPKGLIYRCTSTRHATPHSNVLVLSNAASFVNANLQITQLMSSSMLLPFPQLPVKPEHENNVLIGCSLKIM